MQYHVDVMMSCGVGTKQLIIQCVRQETQGNPIGMIKRGEGPPYGCPVQTIVNVHVIQNIKMVVQTEEGIPVNRRVNYNSYKYQDDAEEKRPCTGINKKKTLGCFNLL